jgi:hypothetical protein
MTLRNADRVRDTSTTTGTGNFTVSGSAPSSYITFSAIPSLIIGDTFWYAIAHQTLNEYEVGLGTWQGSNAFTRTTVYSSSNAGSAVNFSAGTKDVFCALPQSQVGSGGGGTLTVNSTPTSGGAAGQIMFDDGTKLQESAGLIWDNTNQSLTLTNALTSVSGAVRIGTTSASNAIQMASCLVGDTTLTLSSGATTGFPTRGILFLQDLTPGNSEIVSYTGTTASTFTGVTRGLYGTSAAGHTGPFNFASVTLVSAPSTSSTPDLTSMHWQFNNTGHTVFGAVTKPFNVINTGNGAYFENASVNSSLYFAGSVGTTSNGFINSSTNTLFLNSNSTSLRNISGANATFLSPVAAATLQFGATDAASPVAQTTQVQSVVAGTTNTAGADWTAQTSLSTGTGTSGNYVLKTGFAGTSASAVAVTVSSASPAVVTLAAHGFVPGQVVQFAGSPLPTGISAATNYYVSPTSLASGTFQISSTWPTLTPVNTSSTGTSVTVTAQATAQNPASVTATWGPSGLTGSQATSLLSLAQTWNTSGTPAAFKINLTDIASNGSSNFADFQVAGSSKLRIQKDGALVFGGAGYVGATGATLTLAGSGISAQANIALSLGNDIQFTTAGRLSWNSYDLVLSRAAAASLQLGSTDAAAPVAQTLQVQSVVAGTSNTAGVDWIIGGSKGTGTGIGGKIKFQTAKAGTTGTAQNALTDAWAIDGNLQLYPTSTMSTSMTTGFINIPGAAGAPSGTPGNTTGFPMYFDSTNNKIMIYTGAAWKGVVVA